MASILGGMDNATDAVLIPKLSRKRKSSPVRMIELDSSPIKWTERRNPFFDLSSDGPLEDIPSSDDHMSPNKRVRIDDTELIPATERLANLGVESSSEDFDKYDDFSMDDFMDIDDDDVNLKPAVKKKDKEEIIPKWVIPKASTKIENTKPNWLSVHESLAVETEETLGPLSSRSNYANAPTASVLEDDGSVRFFWLDYLELDGKLYFTGKVKDKKTGTWLSSCVTVENLERNLYVLPRKKRVELVDEALAETDIVPSEEDIHDDFDTIRRQMGIKSWRGKFVKRNYVFGEEDIPRGETQWMKVVYSFNGQSASNGYALSPSIAMVQRSLFPTMLVVRILQESWVPTQALSNCWFSNGKSWGHVGSTSNIQ